MHLRRKPCGWYAWGHSRIRNRVEPSIASNNRKDKLTFRIKLMCCMNVPGCKTSTKTSGQETMTQNRMLLRIGTDVQDLRSYNRSKACPDPPLEQSSEIPGEHRDRAHRGCLDDRGRVIPKLGYFHQKANARSLLITRAFRAGASC